MNAPVPLNILRDPASPEPAPRRSRASRHITRVLVASPLVWLAGCAPQPVLQQDSYANLQDCVADWGEEDKCTQDRRSSAGSGNWSTYRYLGPGYWSDERARLARQNLEASRRLASQPAASGARQAGSGASRGGFGNTGRVFSSGGG